MQDARTDDPAVVWIVDDDPDVATHLEMVLPRVAGSAVVRAFVDAAEVLRALDDEPDAVPDLVLVDQVLPDGRGSDLLPEVRRRRPEAIVRLITAAPDEIDDVDRALGVVSKPPSLAVLSALLRHRFP